MAWVKLWALLTENPWSFGIRKLGTISHSGAWEPQGWVSSQTGRPCCVTCWVLVVWKEDLNDLASRNPLSLGDEMPQEKDHGNTDQLGGAVSIPEPWLAVRKPVQPASTPLPIAEWPGQAPLPVVSPGSDPVTPWTHPGNLLSRGLLSIHPALVLGTALWTKQRRPTWGMRDSEKEARS